MSENKEILLAIDDLDDPDRPVRPFWVKADTLEESIRLTAARNERDMRMMTGPFVTTAGTEKFTVSATGNKELSNSSPAQGSGTFITAEEIQTALKVLDCFCHRVKFHDPEADISHLENFKLQLRYRDWEEGFYAGPLDGPGVYFQRNQGYWLKE